MGPVFRLIEALCRRVILWRGSLLPLGCAAVVSPESAVFLMDRIAGFGAASRPSGSKLPRHRSPLTQNVTYRI
ncbi:hypothetical protein F7R06_11330 [Pseudomonas moorei]|nr:hypothetical protein F7R06_11330 [Pseudomonas moorei]PTU02541.1 hypothetical protein DBR45_11780 [Pseudomonas sp. HMWF031]